MAGGQAREGRAGCRGEGARGPGLSSGGAQCVRVCSHTCKDCSGSPISQDASLRESRWGLARVTCKGVTRPGGHRPSGLMGAGTAWPFLVAGAQGGGRPGRWQEACLWRENDCAMSEQHGHTGCRGGLEGSASTQSRPLLQKEGARPCSEGSGGLGTGHSGLPGAHLTGSSQWLPCADKVGVQLRSRGWGAR